MKKKDRMKHLKDMRKSMCESYRRAMQHFVDTKETDYLVSSIAIINTFDHDVLKDGNLNEKQKYEILNTNEDT